VAEIKAEDHLGLVWAVIKSHHFKPIGSLGLDDLFSIGCVGLTSALNTYRPSTGALFSTYAFACIRNSISRALKTELRWTKHHWMRSIKRFEHRIDPAPSALARLINKERSTLFDIALSRGSRDCQFSKRDRDIFKERYTTTKTLEQLGIQYNVTRERIRQILGRIQRKLERNLPVLEAERTETARRFVGCLNLSTFMEKLCQKKTDQV
jgi:RNA polymerase sigma factor (sigma-70 family)